MDLFLILCGLALSAVAVIVTMKYGNHQVKSSTRDKLRELFLLTNGDISLNLRSEDDKQAIHSQFKYVFDFDLRLSTIELITAKNDDYSFLVSCLKNKKHLKEIDNLRSIKKTALRFKKSAIKSWLLLIISYIALAITLYIRGESSIEITSALFGIYLSKTTYTSGFFILIIFLAYRVGNKIKVASFFDQIALREKYLATPAVSKVARQQIFDKITLL